LAPEDAEYKPITFDPADRLTGLTAVFVAGTVLFTKEKDVIMVPNRTLHILDELGIRYYVIETDLSNI